MKIKLILLGLILFGLEHFEINAQDTKSETKSLQINTSFLGFAKIKKFPDGLPFGLGGDYHFKSLMVGGEFQFVHKYISMYSEATLYSDLDLFVGLQKTIGAINTSICSGISVNHRNDPVAGYNDPSNPHEEGYTVIGLPIRANLNYLIGKHFLAGLMGFYNLNPEVSLYGLAINFGYRF